MARDILDWSKPFNTVRTGGFAEGDVAWFPDGELNACYNCVDRHALATPDKVRDDDDDKEQKGVRGSHVAVPLLIKQLLRVC